MTTRLLTTALDEPSGQLAVTDAEGDAEPVLLQPGGVPRMQGVVAARGRLYVTSSRGRYRLGSLYVGAPGSPARGARRGAGRPGGPDPLAVAGQLWSLTEYPRQRLVFTVDLDRLDKVR